WAGRDGGDRVGLHRGAVGGKLHGQGIRAGCTAWRRLDGDGEILALASLDRNARQLLRAIALLEGHLKAARSLRRKRNEHRLGAVVLCADTEIEGRTQGSPQ